MSFVIHSGERSLDRATLNARAARESDSAARLAPYDDAQPILSEEQVPIIPFFVSALNLAVAPRVEGFELNAMDLYFLDRVKAN